MDERRLRTAPLVLGTGILVALSTWAATTTAPRLVALDLVCAAAAVVTSVFVRTRTVPATLAAAALAALSPAATPAVGLGIVLCGLRLRLGVAATVTVAAVVAHALRGLWRTSEGLPIVWWVVVVVAAALACLGWGALGRNRAALVASLAERARRAEIERDRLVAEARAAERTALAREMHDVLAHRLSLLATYAGALEHRPDASEKQRARAATVIRREVHEALQDLRDVVTVLRDDDEDYAAALPTLADVPRLVEESRRAGTRVHLEDTVSTQDCPPAVGRTAYRVVQEGLTNSRKHAEGQPVRVQLGGAPGRDLAVHLTNPVAEPPQPSSGGGHGLIGLTERVRLVGGELDQRRTDQAFELSARLPWPR